MPILTTGTVAAQAIKAAKDGVKKVWLAKNRVLSPGEIEQMNLEVEAAGLNALFAHLSANQQISGVAVGLGSPSGPVTGTLVLPPGSIT